MSAPLSFTPITRSDVDTCDTFHAGPCTVSYGASGRARPSVKSEVWRANGRVQTWKRDPERFRLPIKHGLRDYADITDLGGRTDARDWRAPTWTFHRADTCPAVAEAAAWYSKGDRT